MKKFLIGSVDESIMNPVEIAERIASEIRKKSEFNDSNGNSIVVAPQHPWGYWTVERVFAEGKKYKTRMQFKRACGSAYAVACRKKLLKDMTWLISDTHKKKGPRKNHKYSFGVIKEIIESNNCKTISDLVKVNETAWREAKRNNWLETLGLQRVKQNDGYWTIERVWKAAQECSSKGEFKEKYSTAYKWASYYGLLTQINWMKCPTYDEIRNLRDSYVYAYFDDINKVVYVGLTIDIQNRKSGHKYQKNSAVSKYFGENIPEPVILMENLTIDESTYYEDVYKRQYAEKGYRILNVAPTGLGVGSIGGIPKWTSKEMVIEESKKYHSRSEFKRKAGGAYNHAKANGWLDEMIWLSKPNPKEKWTHDVVIEESKKYEFLLDFIKKSPSAYDKARRMGWIVEMTWLKIKTHPQNYWTRERVFEESRKYTSKKDFKINGKGAYLKAYQNKWFDEMPWLIPLPLGPVSSWTRETIIEESKKYHSITEFARQSPTAYSYARMDKSIYAEMPWLKRKNKPAGYWNDKSRVMEESKKYKNRRAFSEGSYSAWKKAKQMGWIEEMTWFDK